MVARASRPTRSTSKCALKHIVTTIHSRINFQKTIEQKSSIEKIATLSLLTSIRFAATSLALLYFMNSGEALTTETGAAAAAGGGSGDGGGRRSKIQLQITKQCSSKLQD